MYDNVGGRRRQCKRLACYPCASAAEIEEAEIDAAIAEHEARKAAGRPGGSVSHAAAMAELLGGD